MYRRKKNLFKLISATLIMMMQLCIFGPVTVMADSEGSASDVSFPFITNVTLKDTDTDKVLGGADATGVAKDANVSVTFDFEIPNDKTVPEGSEYSLTLPKEIALFNALTDVPLRDANGEIAAYLDIGADGAGKIEFTEYASTHSNVGGSFTINGYFNKDNISNTTPVVIPFEVQGRTEPYTVDVYFQQPDAANTKSEKAYDAATGTVTWEVLLNTNKTTIEGGIFTDQIKPGHTAADKSQTYVDKSFKVNSVGRYGSV